MATKTLGEALISAIVQGMVIGDAGAATPAISRKSAEPEGPASVTGRHVIREGETTLQNPENWTPPTIGRSIATARPTRIPTSAVVIDLVMYREKGGRTTQGRKLDRPTYRSSPYRRARETGLRVVSG